MPYVTQDYYEGEFHGASMIGSEFESLLDRASEIIEEMTMYRVTEQTFSSFPDDTRERIRKAVCAQIEYLDANGGSELDTGGGGFQSASLGRFSYTAGAGADGSLRQSIYAPRALRILAPTGLLYRGGGCL